MKKDIIVGFICSPSHQFSFDVNGWSIQRQNNKGFKDDINTI